MWVKALPSRVSLSPRLYTSAVSMKLIPLSRASFTIRVVSSCPRLPMFILPPNCIVPSATSLTMSPVLPSFLYFICHTPYQPAPTLNGSPKLQTQVYVEEVEIGAQQRQYARHRRKGRTRPMGIGGS